MNGGVNYSDTEESEILAAIETLRGNRTSICKSLIWSEIDNHPDKYPVMATRAPKRILTLISWVMNDRYALFGGYESRKGIRNAVWTINREKITA